MGHKVKQMKEKTKKRKGIRKEEWKYGNVNRTVLSKESNLIPSGKLTCILARNIFLGKEI